MEATINISDSSFADVYKKGYDDCSKAIDKIIEIKLSQEPYIKGYAGLQKYLGIGYNKVQEMLADGLKCHERCGITFFLKTEVEKYLIG